MRGETTDFMMNAYCAMMVGASEDFVNSARRCVLQETINCKKYKEGYICISKKREHSPQICYCLPLSALCIPTSTLAVPALSSYSLLKSSTDCFLRVIFLGRNIPLTGLSSGFGVSVLKFSKLGMRCIKLGLGVRSLGAELGTGRIDAFVGTGWFMMGTWGVVGYTGRARELMLGLRFGLVAE
jgi:hypothetical protein